MTSYKFFRAEKFLTKPVDEISLKISIDSENGINSIYSLAIKLISIEKTKPVHS